jgi:Uma2 family endonuclease
MVQQLKKSELVYPDCDGQPMSDNTLQFSWIVKIKENLEILFANNADVFVAGDLLWYPVEGNNNIKRAPDAMAVFGRPKGYRGSYQQWLEDNIAPQVVFEILSPGNRMAEMTAKFEFYDQYGVEEYYIYNPEQVDFTGWLRQAGRLQGISNISGWISPRLGVRFELNDELEIYTPKGELFLSPLEIAQKAEAAQLEAARQQVRATVAEAQALQEGQRATVAEEQAQQERQQKEIERDRADAAEQKAAAMAEQLKALGIEPSL